MIRPTILVFVLFSGCSNPCEELADKVCDRAGTDLSECTAAASVDGDAAACARIQGVVASCRTLLEKAPAADREDQTACKADLELIRALERAQN